MQRKTPMKRGGRIRTVGRRGKMNRAAQAAGDAKIIAAGGIDWCELHYPGICIGRSLPLQRVHRKKRRYCDAAELEIFAIGCQACHHHIEFLPEAEMFQKVTEAINRRTT